MSCKIHTVSCSKISGCLLTNTSAQFCSLASQQTVLVPRFHKTLPSLVLQHTEDVGSPLLAPHKETSCCKFLCCVLETILLLVVSLWKAHFLLPFRKTPDATLKAKPVAQPRVGMLESQPTLSAWVHHTMARNPPLFYSVTS